MEALTRQAPLEEVADEPYVSVVLPCLDEAESIASCVNQAQAAMDEAGMSGEVVVVDNGSTDGSGALARGAGARVVYEPRRGYGRAYLSGLTAARGRYVLMADGDGSYDLADLPRFVQELEAGADVVLGSRLRGNIEPGAMPWLHRRIGNPVLTGILNLFFGAGVSDAHCGMRAFRRSLLSRLELRTTGMEFASEHVIRATKCNLDIREIPIDYRRRVGRSKLSALTDGWRHLRLLLVHSPTWLFVIPGAVLSMLGLLAAVVVLGDVQLFGRAWHLHTLIAAAMLILVGSQVLQFGAFARAYAALHLGEEDRLFQRFRAHVRLETALLAGVSVLFVGGAICGTILVLWVERGFGPLREEHLAVVGLTFVVLGIQAIFGSFLLSVLALKAKPTAVPHSNNGSAESSVPDSLELAASPAADS